MMMSAVSGKDIDRFPQYYVPYEDVADGLLKRARPLADLGKGALAKQTIDAFLEHAGGKPEDYVGLPLQGRLDGYTMVVSAATHQPLTALPIDPW